LPPGTPPFFRNPPSGTAGAVSGGYLRNTTAFLGGGPAALAFCKSMFNFGARPADMRKSVTVMAGAHMTNAGRFIGIVTLVFAAATPALAQQAVAQQSGAAAGRIKVASGSAYVVRANLTIPAQVGDVVFESDQLRTGADGALGVTLKDDTRVSLGPSSEVRLEHFVYAPAEGGLGLVLKFVRGVAAYVSGRIAKLAPDAIRLETPSAIVGVRGTSLAIRVEPK
jgi:ferric-dicitrate binding protein FerR (iron transport regulator)